MTPIKKVLSVAVLTCAVMSMSACGNPLGWLFTGTTYDSASGFVSGLTYYGPESYGSAPAVIKMWRKFYTGDAASQSDINTWLSDNAGTYTVGPTLDGVGAQNFSYALLNYGGSVAVANYDETATCNGGRSCFAQGLADMQSSISDHNPVIIHAYNTAYALVKQWGGSRRCTTPGCQPSVDFFYMDIPKSGYGAGVYVTTGAMPGVWQNNTVLHWAWFRDSSYDNVVSNDDWSEADSYATTYYGDPDPPEPVYSNEEAGGGDGDAPPIIQLATAAVGRTAAAAMRIMRAARVNNVIVPNPKTQRDVVADFVAGMRRTNLSHVKALQSVSLEDLKYAVAAVDHVRSLDEGRPDYYLITLVDRLTKKVVAEATVSASGLLQCVRRVGEQEATGVVSSQAKASALLTGKLGTLRDQPELAFAANGLATTEFEPFYVSRLVSGDMVAVTKGGQIYPLVRVAAPASPTKAGVETKQPRIVVTTRIATKQ